MNDLTSLLDVILILLYLVLMSASQKVEISQAKAAGNHALVMQIKQLKEENETLSHKADTNFVINKNCFIVTLLVEKKEDNSRKVRLESENMQTQQVDLTWENSRYVKNVLSAQIDRMTKSAFAKGYQVGFIVFQYDRNEIYQADYRLINSVIQTQKSNKNIYCAEYDRTESEING